MPTYQIECHDCGRVEDRRLTYSEYDQVKSGAESLRCAGCNQPARFGFSPGSLGFILKEGESGGWASKSIKENAYRKNRIPLLTQRRKDHVRTSKLQPNYHGVETGTWKEAQEVARTEKGNSAASSYDSLVSKERVAT